MNINDIMTKSQSGLHEIKGIIDEINSRVNKAQNLLNEEKLVLTYFKAISKENKSIGISKNHYSGRYEFCVTTNVNNEDIVFYKDCNPEHKLFIYKHLNDFLEEYLEVIILTLNICKELVHVDNP